MTIVPLLVLTAFVGYLLWERDRREKNNEQSTAAVIRWQGELIMSQEKMIAKPPIIVPAPPTPPTPPSPPLPDISAIVKEMGEAFAKTIAGYGQPQYAPPDPDAAFMTELAGKYRPGRPTGPFIPESELDPFMDLDPSMVGQTVPVRGGWFTQAGGPAPDGYVPTENGSVERVDGQPMFRSGEGATPPAGGNEDG